MRWLDGIIDVMDISLKKLCETVEERGAWHDIVHKVSKSWMGFNNSTTTTMNKKCEHEKGVRKLLFI